MIKNECVEVAIAELERCGLTWRIEDGGKHQAIKWTVKIAGLPVERSFTLPYSHSDWRAPLNTKSDLRKILRNDGILDEQEQVTNNTASFERMVEFFSSKLEEYNDRLKKHDGHFQVAKDRLDKMADDIEGLMSLLNSPASGVSSSPVVSVDISTVSPEMQSILLQQPQMTALARVDPLTVYEEGEEVNYAMLEAECAAELRLPPRDGYRVVPEHYARLDEPAEADDEERVSAADLRSAPAKKRKTKITLSGLENLKARLAKAKAQKALADQGDAGQE